MQDANSGGLENNVEPVSSWNGILQLLLSCLRNCYIWLSNIYCAPFASKMYVQHCGCCYDSECSRRSVGRCSTQVVTGIFQWTMALITGRSEETHTVWTTRGLRVWTQCWQMISWVSCGRREGLFQWTNKSTVELWSMGRKSTGYVGHDIL